MAKDPSYPMYAQDFDMDTAAWGIDEIGVYIRLLNYEWINGYIPSDLNRISKIARISPRKLQKIWEIIENKFSQNGTGNLQNRRMEEEREKRIKYIEFQRESGRKGAKKRWKGHGNPISDPNGNPNGENIALQSSSSLKKERKKESPVEPPLLKGEGKTLDPPKTNYLICKICKKEKDYLRSDRICESCRDDLER